MNIKTIDKLSIKERFCLDAYIINKDADMAYIMSRNAPSNATKESIHRLALQWLRQTPIRQYIENQQAILQGRNATIEKSYTPNRTKADIIAELNDIASRTHDAKQRSDILIKIAELEKMKDKNELEEERVHYYLPMKCLTCELYIKHKEDENNKN